MYHNEGRLNAFQETDSVLFALDTLLAASLLAKSQSKGDPRELVGIPLWALNAVAERYDLYARAHITNRTTKFGEAFGIEGGGQGQKPKIRQHMRDARNRALCLSIALMKRRTEMTLDEIFSKLASDEIQHTDSSKAGISTEHLKRIWNELRDQANAAIVRATQILKNEPDK